MAINKYFNLYTTGHTNEQDTVHSLNEEAIQIMGTDVYYLPRTLQKEDLIFGEDVLSAFNTAYTIEMYIDDVQGFQGDRDLLMNFGLVIRDEVNMTVAVRRFQQETGMNKPMEGDLIYLPMSKGLFEIRFVEDEVPFYPLGTLPVFKLKCALFDWSEENMNTAIPEIDQIETDLAVDPFGDNPELQTEGDAVKDTTEDNVFGKY